MPDLNDVDWSRLPQPVDDGGARHLPRLGVPPIALASTDGTQVILSKLPGRSVVFAYPMTGRPGHPLPDGWDGIPGARGCTPQACSFRDLHQNLFAAGACRVFGLATQDTAYQSEAAARLHLPYPLLSDSALEFATALKLPVMVVGGEQLLKRLTFVIDDGRITTVFYPVFPPDRNASNILAWLKKHPQ